MERMNVNKDELARRLALHAGMSHVDAKAVIGFVVDEIKTAVADGEQVSLAGFGVFEPRHRAPRRGRNPRKNIPHDIPARTVPTFRAGSSFRRFVQDTTQQRNST
jgi:nucleoid DNA-binding protein